MQIILKDILLFGYHGVHPMEQKTGTHFKINLIIEVDDKKVVDLNDTIDYTEVYNSLKHSFHQTERLLEVLADKIIDAISSKFKQILHIEIEILKLDPPIPSFQGAVGIKKSKKLN
ncbi:MAG: Dihydroneopterin aldolase [Bacteroidota bacterium]|jgi:dihydroneopterin aldolase